MKDASHNLESDLNIFCEAHYTYNLTRILGSEGPRIHIHFCLILWAVSIIVSNRAVILSTFSNRQRTSKTMKPTNNSSFSKGNSKDFSTGLLILGKGSLFLIKASQWLYLRWHSSPTSLKSLPIKGAEDLNKKQQDSAILLCHYSVKSNNAKHLDFIFKLYLRNPKESVHLFSLH